MTLELKFDPKTIEHLGVRMYSTLPPALAELISNSYDADASVVSLEFFEQNGTPKAITVYDDGLGMSLEDIQKKFLVIGRNRRHLDGDTPSKNYQRLPTGKKGLGKLALFGLAKEITVDTVHNGLQNRFKLDWHDLLASDETYNPKIEITDQKTTRSNGTIIQLSELKRRTGFDLEAIADSLSKIFSVDNTFKISLKDSTGKTAEVTNERRYKNIEQQFHWSETDLIKPDDPYHGRLKLSLITAKTPIPPSSGMRGVSLFSRGKLVNAPEYFSESTSSHFYQYLTGWIEADFIDLLDEDVISTNRQSLNWDHPEMSLLRNYLSKIMTAVGHDWRRQRTTSKEKDVEKVTGINTTDWFTTLPGDIRESVETIVKKMGDSEEVSETFAPVLQALYRIVPEYPLLHWRHLHDTIKAGVEQYYKNAQYGHAADQGAKLYAEKLRQLSKKDLDGTDLATLFGHQYDKQNNQITQPPVVPINDLTTESFRNMQHGQAHLTRGLMQGFRNPVNHAPINSVIPELISELDCLNILSLVSYLAGKLDYASSQKAAP
ncbi:TIGR02391 family protein [Hydrogenophaga sp. BPS33]|uniref:TIGR02391 family protein n=1 Tax=Hydrogenophaga sp. BPS33 TaxID=2651974 RepID=UPI001320160F|nr:TIGR02391 family protein [Hydrogenophaga sp. BPS33]QHE85070.1 TIGR02391 family protein [Hydrogenophaga sp. BPS33]